MDIENNTQRTRSVQTNHVIRIWKIPLPIRKGHVVADAFKNIFLGPSINVLSAAQQKGSNGLVQQTVASDKNAIGYVSLDFLNGVSPVGYQGVPCNLRNAKSGQYAGTRNFWMVTRGKATGATAAWIKWIQNDAKARAIVNTDWISIK